MSVLQQETVPFPIGETLVHARVFRNGAAAPTFLSIHDDEDTAVAAGKANLAESGGRLIELAHTGNRLITFALDGQRYTFDPNRIFSDTGIEKTLSKEGVYSVAAHGAVARFAQEYARAFALEREPVIIALHNITDSDFSVRSFLPGADYGGNVVAIHVSPARDRFDFFFTTDRGFFDALKSRDFNVVLQDNERVEDDGSLSVYFARKGIPYVNVEADLSHLAEQTAMLRVLRQVLAGHV